MIMTRDEILKLPAGREMDGLIDEAVFGIDRTPNTPSRIMEAWRSAQPLGPYGMDDIPLCLGGVVYHAAHDPQGKRGPFETGWVWEQREGKPYQAALEKHVAEWRAPARAPYSTSIAAAWQAMERMAQTAGPHGTPYTCHVHGGPSWTCQFCAGCVCHANEATAETAPLSICRAALLAVLKPTCPLCGGRAGFCGKCSPAV